MKSLNVTCNGYPERESAEKESVCLSVWNNGAALNAVIWFTAGEARHVANLLNEAIKQAETVAEEEEQ